MIGHHDAFGNHSNPVIALGGVVSPDVIGASG